MPHQLYHGSPAWFVGENAVVRLSARPNGAVPLRFWNGKTLGEPALAPVGTFQAAQVRSAAVSDISTGDLRRWLRKAGEDTLDLAAMRKGVTKRRADARGGSRPSTRMRATPRSSFNHSSKNNHPLLEIQRCNSSTSI